MTSFTKNPSSTAREASAIASRITAVRHRRPAHQRGGVPRREREFALQRHRELRPDHAGRLVRFEYRNEERDDVREMFAVHTPEELRAVIDHIEADGRGKPMGEQMLATRMGRTVLRAAEL